MAWRPASTSARRWTNHSSRPTWSTSGSRNARAPGCSSAAIISNDISRVHQFVNRIEAGLITVNLPTAGVEYQLPFGGTKESSFGMREQGPQALDFYSELRTVYLKYTQQ